MIHIHYGLYYAVFMIYKGKVLRGEEKEGGRKERKNCQNSERRCGTEEKGVWRNEGHRTWGGRVRGSQAGVQTSSKACNGLIGALNSSE